MIDTVTIVARRRVKPGRDAEYDAWLKRMTEGASSRFPGYTGFGFHWPTHPGDTNRQVFRFDSVEQLEAFERSDYRAGLLAEGAELFEADTSFERMTGLEFWFDPPKGTKLPQQSPHRMALVMIVVVFTMIRVPSTIIGALTPGWPQPLRLLLTVTVQVCLMTYLVMPKLTPLIAGYIYPGREPCEWVQWRYRSPVLWQMSQTSEPVMGLRRRSPRTIGPGTSRRRQHRGAGPVGDTERSGWVQGAQHARSLSRHVRSPQKESSQLICAPKRLVWSEGAQMWIE